MGGWLGGWVLDFTRLMLISTQVEVVVEVGVELGESSDAQQLKTLSLFNAQPSFPLLFVVPNVCIFVTISVRIYSPVFKTSFFVPNYHTRHITEQYIRSCQQIPFRQIFSCVGSSIYVNFKD